jgi:MFS transporter, DHA1 family, multidrug resistance protein
VFGLTFVDRSLGPVLPLYVAELGADMNDVPLISGVLFSISAGAGAIGNTVCRMLLARTSTRALIAASAAVGALGTLAYAFAGGLGLLLLGTPLLGLAIGAASTAAYTTAGGVIPPHSRGTGFGLLSTGSLVGLALSPILCGLLGSLSLRAVFVLDTIVLVLLAILVRRLMVTSRLTPTAPPATEEV